MSSRPSDEGSATRSAEAATRGRPVRLILVRHGETAPNRSYRFVGAGDDELTEEGRRQAEELGEALAGLGLAAVMASPLRRTAATAAAIARRAGLPVTLEPRLREQHYGDWEGLTRQEVLERSGGGTAEALENPHRAPPRGESLAAVAARVEEAVGELSRSHAGSSVVLVSHVGPIKALLCSALGLPLTGTMRFFLDPGTLSVVDWGQRPVVRLINALPHRGLERARWLAGGEPPLG